MNLPEENDPIDALLREQNAYLDDAGFTNRVIQSLPRRRRAWLRPVILSGAIAIGSVLAIRWLPWGNLLALDLSSLKSLFAADSPTLLSLVTVLAVGASLVWSIISVLQRED
jgi:hypothetical protein